MLFKRYVPIFLYKAPLLISELRMEEQERFHRCRQDFQVQEGDIRIFSSGGMVSVATVGCDQSYRGGRRQS